MCVFILGWGAPDDFSISIVVEAKYNFRFHLQEFYPIPHTIPRIPDSLGGHGTRGTSADWQDLLLRTDELLLLEEQAPGFKVASSTDLGGYLLFYYRYFCQIKGSMLGVAML